MNTILQAALLSALLAAPLIQEQEPAQSAAPQGATGSNPSTSANRGDSYYYFALGHVQEQEFESSGSADAATQAIDSYKKALSLDPGSTVIMERLAEIYAKSQHIRDAVVEAQEVLKADPNDVSAHRLLA